MFDRLASSAVSARGSGGIDRREFVRICTMAAASVGLPAAAGVKMAEAAAKGIKPSVIWLHFQECTGCSESLLRTSHPALAKLILDLVSLDYHETLFAAAGHQAEDALHAAMKANAGQYVCVVEGAIPTKDDGIYCKIAGRTALEIVREVADQAAAIIAIGSCASWGGIPSADPNPTGARGAPQVLEGKTVVTIPGCPANPYNFLGTVLQFVALGSLPALDEQGRPLFAYGRRIHDHCPRRAHFDAGRFVLEFGDEGHRQGWCLYRMGCKGPQTHANCSTMHFGEEPGAWPIGIGHPCFGCTEQRIGFRVPLHDTVPIDRPVPPDTYPPIEGGGGGATAIGAGVAGLVLGAAAGAGVMATRRLGEKEKEASGGSSPGEE